MSNEQPSHALFKPQFAALTGLESEVECDFAARAVLVGLSTMMPAARREDNRAELPRPLQDAFARPPDAMRKHPTSEAHPGWRDDP